MNEIELTVYEQIKEIEELIFNNEELEQLESIVDKFNKVFYSINHLCY